MADIDFDAVLSQVGERGRYQNRLYYLLCIPATLPAIFLVFNQVFVSATPDHWCSEPSLEEVLGPGNARQLSVPFTLRSDGTREFSRCEMYDTNFTALLANTDDPASLTPDPSWNRTSCRHGWSYDRSEYTETLVSQLDIVCDKSWWVATSTTCFSVGSLVGNVLFGMVGDRLGRRPAFLYAVLWHVVFSTATAFSSDYIMYTALRSVNALVFPAIYQVPFVLAMEIMGMQHRTYAGMMLCVYFALAMAFLALITMFIRHWFWLLISTSTPFVLLVSYYWLIPESPRWLLSKGRIQEAEVIVQKMAKVNGNPVPPNFLKTFQAEQLKTASPLVRQIPPAAPEDVNTSPLDMLKRPLLRRTFIVISLEWVAEAVVYSGLTYNSSNLGVSDQIGFLISAAVELPSYAFAWVAMDRLGRRFVVASSMVVGGLACVSCGFVPSGMVWLTVTLAMVGKFGSSAAFAAFYVYVGELLATVVRSQSMALASFIAHFGLLGFPFIVHLATYNPILPLLVFGGLSLIGATASLLLPETLGQPLPQTLQDAEDLHARQQENKSGCCGLFAGDTHQKLPTSEEEKV